MVFHFRISFSGLKKSDVSYYLYYGVQGRPAAIRVDDWKLIFDIPVGGAGEKKKKKIRIIRI